MKKTVSLLLALMMCSSLLIPANAILRISPAPQPVDTEVISILSAPVEELPAEELPAEDDALSDETLFALYPDAEGHWGVEIIRACVEADLFGGIEPGVFGPEETVTGELFITVLARLAGVEMSDEDALETALAWAREKGFIGEMFVARNPILRQEIALLFYRFVHTVLPDVEKDVLYPCTDEITARFTAAPDYADIASGSLKAMAWAYGNGIMSGDEEDDRLRPLDQATRVEAAALLLRLVDLCGLSVEASEAPAEESEEEPADCSTIILLYHELTEDEAVAEENPTLYVTADMFRSQLEALLELGYVSISMEDYHQGKTEAGKTYFIVTLDDGYLSNYTLAFPILEELGVYADIFINTDNVELAHHFSYAQAQEMEESGYVKIYSHFPVHQDLCLLTEAEFAAEYTRGFEALKENLTGERSYFFAYPYGSCNADTYQWSLALGAEIQCVQNPNFIAEGVVRRVTVSHGDDIAAIAAAAPKN